MQCNRLRTAGGVWLSVLLLAGMASPVIAEDAEQEAVIRGVVLDAEGNPAADVAVEVHTFHVRFEGRTDSEGSFALSVPADLHVLGASLIARTPDKLQMDTSGSPGTSRSHRLIRCSYNCDPR